MANIDGGHSCKHMTTIMKGNSAHSHTLTHVVLTHRYNHKTANLYTFVLTIYKNFEFLTTGKSGLFVNLYNYNANN